MRKKLTLIILTLTFAMVNVAGAVADDAAKNTPDPFSALMRLVGSMIIVLGLIVAAAYVGRKVMSGVRMKANREGGLQVRQVVNLGAKRQVFIFDVGPHSLVVGTTGESMRLLAKLPKLERAEASYSEAQMDDGNLMTADADRMQGWSVTANESARQDTPLKRVRGAFDSVLDKVKSRHATAGEGHTL